MKFEYQKFKLRTAQQNDWERVIDIYNQAVLEFEKTADTDIQTVEDKADWLSQHLNSKHPILIAELDSKIVGWCSLSPHRPGRKSLENTAEISYYVDRAFRRQGIGSFLIDAAFTSAIENGIKNLFAILLETNNTSIAILRKFGFEKWGYLPKIAEIDGKVFGQFIYGKNLFVNEIEE